MKITVFYNLSEKRIIEAIAEGKVLSKSNSVDIELDEISNEEKESLSDILMMKDGKLYVSNIIDREDKEGVLSYAKQVTDLKKSNFERNRNVYIKELQEFKNGNSRYIFGTGIYSDGSGNFNFTILSEQIAARKLAWNLEFNETEIIELAKKYQAQVEKDRIERKQKYEAEEALKKSIKADEKAAYELCENELLVWATKNGSELLKLRIKHKQNWTLLANNEYALSTMPGWEYAETGEEWVVRNATYDQLIALENAKAEYPDCKILIIRSRFEKNDDYDNGEPEICHRTFLKAEIKTPLGEENLYKEIDDVSEVDE